MNKREDDYSGIKGNKRREWKKGFIFFKEKIRAYILSKFRHDSSLYYFLPNNSLWFNRIKIATGRMNQ